MEPREAFTAWQRAGRGKTGRALSGHTPELYYRDVADWLDHCAATGIDPYAVHGDQLRQWATTRPGPRPAKHTADSRLDSTSRHSYERRQSALAAWYTWCKEQRLVLDVPTPARHRSYDGVPGLYKPSSQEREALAEACAEWTGGQRAPQPRRDQVIIHMMLWGLRRRQITALDLTDVHGRSPYMTLDLRHATGDGIDRAHPVPPAVARAIDRYLPHRRGPADTGPLITSRTGRCLDPNTTPATILRAIATTHPTLAPIARRLTPDGVSPR